MASELRDAAFSALAAGVSIIPIDAGTKRPLAAMLPRGEDGKPSWKYFQDWLAALDVAESWFGPELRAFAGVGGAVSGNLLVIDFDVPDFFEMWLAATGTLSGPGVVQKTGGGCYQWWGRSDAPVGGNEKLAWSPAENEQGREVAIETRGEGGYAVMAPSIHPSGRRYEFVKGDWASLPVLPDAQIRALVDAARRLCKAPFSKQDHARAKAAPRPKRPVRDGASVIEAFNQRNALPDVLASFGYTPAWAGRYNRPGGETAGVLLSSDGNRSFHFSSNDPLNDGHQHDAFDVCRLLRYGGDFTAAVRQSSLDMGMNAEAPQRSSVTVQPDTAPKPDRLKAMIEATISGARRNIPWTLPKITELARSLINGTCTVLCGGPGAGKSFLVTHEFIHWFEAGERFAAKVLEEPHEFHMHRAMAQLEGDDRLQDPRWGKANPKEYRAAHEKHEAFLNGLGECIEDAEQDETHEDLLRWAERKASDGAEIIVIDPVTMADGKTGRVFIDDKLFVKGLRNLQNKYGVRTLLVTHPRGGKPSDDPLDNVCGGQAYKRFTQSVFVLRSFKRHPRACRVRAWEPAMGMENDRLMYLSRSIGIAKSRNGRGEGVEVAVEMDDRTLGWSEVGVVRAEATKKEMEGLSPPGPQP